MHEGPRNSEDDTVQFSSTFSLEGSPNASLHLDTGNGCILSINTKSLPRNHVVLLRSKAVNPWFREKAVQISSYANNAGWSWEQFYFWQAPSVNLSPTIHKKRVFARQKLLTSYCSVLLLWRIDLSGGGVCLKLVISPRSTTHVRRICSNPHEKRRARRKRVRRISFSSQLASPTD